MKSQTHDVEIQDSLLKAGIPRRYAQKEVTLDMYLPEGDKLGDQIRSKEFCDDISAGVGVFLHGDGIEPLAVAYLTARACILRRIPTVCLGLEDVYQTLANNPQGFQDYRVICITSFCLNQALPYSPREVFIISNFLQRWLDNGNGLILQSQCKNVSAWWGTFLTSYIDEYLKKFEIKKAGAK
jgi:hypothetical protein